MLNWTELIKECESDLLNGDAKKASAKLSSLNPAKVPRKYSFTVANLAYRSGLDNLGLKILTPLMLNEGGRPQDPPTAQELSEYAMLLRRAGAVQESSVILSKLKHDEHPISLLYLAFCHFNLWDYAAAVPYLKRYLEFPLAEYPRVVGQVNLAAALVSAQSYDEARELLDSIIATCRAREFWRLECNALELRSQIHLQYGRLADAKADLNIAADRLGQANIPDQLFVQKWLAVIEGLETGDASHLRRFKEQALERRHWESAREADLYALKIAFDREPFHFLYFGTPHSSYRERIRAQLKREPDLSHYVWGGGKERPKLDLESGKLLNGRDLVPGAQIHQVLNALLGDFYRPRLLGELFSDLFPGEHFNVFSSPDRVHQCLRRARRWMEDNGVPGEIAGLGSRFYLRMNADFPVRLPLDRRPLNKNEVALQKLRAAFSPDRTFTKSEGMKSTGLSAEAFKTFAAWAVGAGWLLRFGAGPATVYQLDS